MKNIGVYSKASFKETRIKSGFSLRSISKAAGLTPAVLCRLEKGGAILPSTARKVCEVMKCEFDELFEIKQEGKE